MRQAIFYLHGYGVRHVWRHHGYGFGTGPSADLYSGPPTFYRLRADASSVARAAGLTNVPRQMTIVPSLFFAAESITTHASICNRFILCAGSYHLFMLVIPVG